MRYAINQNFCGNVDNSFNNFIKNFFLVLYKMLRSILKTVLIFGKTNTIM